MIGLLLLFILCIHYGLGWWSVAVAAIWLDLLLQVYMSADRG